MSKKKEMFLIPPIECLDNGCTLKSVRCKYCGYKDCAWFIGTSSESGEGEKLPGIYKESLQLAEFH